VTSSASTDGQAGTSPPAPGWQRAWQPLIDAVGTDFGHGISRAGPDAVEPGALRRFCEPLEFGCPLHHDDAVAREHGYAGVVAPVSAIVTFTIPPLWRAGEPPVFTSPARNAQPARTGLGPRRTGLEPETTGFFAAETGADYLAPVEAGDRLHQAGDLLVSCVPKQTRVGRGAFITWQSQIRNERDVVVARLRSTSFSYVPHPHLGPAADPAPQTSEAAPSADADAPEWEAESEAPDLDWDRQPCWEDLVPGQALPAVAFPLSVYRLVMAAGASRDFNSIHHNTEWARLTGAPEMYANVVFLQGMWERCVRQFIGLGGQIRRISGFRMSSFNVAGDTPTVAGEVARTWSEDDTGLAELRVWTRNRAGISVGPGTVTVSLPRRSDVAGRTR
jgi:acyl dehydratase